MTPVYHESRSTVRPSSFEIDTLSVFLRKDIIETTKTYGEDIVTIYTYQEAELSFDEFNEYSRMIMAQNALKATNDSDNIVKIISGQEASDFNQLTLMGAIADLYEMLLAYTEANQNG